jgi:hypothetical protein
MVAIGFRSPQLGVLLYPNHRLSSDNRCAELEH